MNGVKCIIYIIFLFIYFHNFLWNIWSIELVIVVHDFDSLIFRVQTILVWVENSSHCNKYEKRWIENSKNRNKEKFKIQIQKIIRIKNTKYYNWIRLGLWRHVKSFSLFLDGNGLYYYCWKKDINLLHKSTFLIYIYTLKTVVPRKIGLTHLIILKTMTIVVCFKRLIFNTIFIV